MRKGEVQRPEASEIVLAWAFVGGFDSGLAQAPLTLPTFLSSLLSVWLLRLGTEARR